MEAHYSTVTSKGQVTIPQNVREQMNIKAGDKVIFATNGKMAQLYAKNLPLSELSGALHDKNRTSLTLEEIQEAMEKSVAAECLKSLGHDRH